MANVPPLDVPVRLRLADDDVAALVVGPDDRLVVNVGTRVSAEELDGFRELLAECLPDLAGRVLLVAAEQIAVIRPGEEPGT
jgi:hypothetical protein